MLARLKSITARAPATLLGNWRTLGSDKAAVCVEERGGEERRSEEGYSVQQGQRAHKLVSRLVGQTGLSQCGHCAEALKQG